MFILLTLSRKIPTGILKAKFGEDLQPLLKYQEKTQFSLHTGINLHGGTSFEVLCSLTVNVFFPFLFSIICNCVLRKQEISWVNYCEIINNWNTKISGYF